MVALGRCIFSFDTPGDTHHVPCPNCTNLSCRERAAWMVIWCWWRSSYVLMMMDMRVSCWIEWWLNANQGDPNGTRAPHATTQYSAWQLENPFDAFQAGGRPKNWHILNTFVINFPLGGGGIKFYSGIDEHLHFNPSQQPFDDNLNKFTDWRVNGHTGIRKCSKSDWSDPLLELRRSW